MVEEEEVAPTAELEEAVPRGDVEQEEERRRAAIAREWKRLAAHLPPGRRWDEAPAQQEVAVEELARVGQEHIRRGRAPHRTPPTEVRRSDRAHRTPSTRLRGFHLTDNPATASQRPSRAAARRTRLQAASFLTPTREEQARPPKKN